jgi:hypothetical protein
VWRRLAYWRLGQSVMAYHLDFVVETLVAEAMRIERQAFVDVAPYECSDACTGQACGFMGRSF